MGFRLIHTKWLRYLADAIQTELCTDISNVVRMPAGSIGLSDCADGLDFRNTRCSQTPLTWHLA